MASASSDHFKQSTMETGKVDEACHLRSRTQASCSLGKYLWKLAAMWVFGFVAGLNYQAASGNKRFLRRTYRSHSRIDNPQWTKVIRRLTARPRSWQIL